MIPVQIPGIFFIFLFLILPVLCLIGTISLPLVVVLQSRTAKGRERMARHKRKLLVGGLFVALIDLVYGYVLYDSYKTYLEIKEEGINREKRARFTLPHATWHGELLIPAGTQIVRYDAFDNGEPDRPQKLTGLISARFPEPILIADAWAIAIQHTGGELELARDQTIQGRTCKKGGLQNTKSP